MELPSARTDTQADVRRAISVPLTPVKTSFSRSLTDRPSCSSDRIEARTTQLPKLIVRVRFPSPAPDPNPQLGCLIHLCPASPRESPDCGSRARSARGTLRARRLQLPPGHPVERRGEPAVPAPHGRGGRSSQREPDLPHRRGTWRRRSGRGYERRNSSRATSRNGTIRYTAIPKYNATASHGKTSPSRIAITYPITTGRSLRCGPSTSSPSPCGE